MVLAIAGMVLAIIFSIGLRAGDVGFGLGRRALEASDSDISRSDFRVTIQSMALRPTNTFAPSDPVTRGNPTRLETEVVMARSTQCALKGWAGILTIEILPETGGGGVVMCRAGTREVVLFRLPDRSAALSYSTDGLTWSTDFENTPEEQQDFGNIRSAALWVRLSAAPDLDLVARASSSRPELWARPDAL